MRRRRVLPPRDARGRFVAVSRPRVVRSGARRRRARPRATVVRRKRSPMARPAANKRQALVNRLNAWLRKNKQRRGEDWREYRMRGAQAVWSSWDRANNPRLIYGPGRWGK